jgi:sugar-specific transcriptional regulator TrmB
MADDSEFITRLISFGLSEKEAQLYLHLLKYGPKPPSLLAKSLKTYREDIYRTLTGLIDKGMVNPSLETPTVYTAVELNIALEAAFKKHESELREMERKKEELQELSQQQRFRPSDEFSTFKIIKSVKEAAAIAISTMTSLERRFLWVAPGSTVIAASLFGINEAVKKLIERGGCVRGICDVTYPIIEPVQELLDIGEDVRHFSQYRGIYLGVYDSKLCWSSINVDLSRISLNEPLSVLQTDNSTYINYLVSTFEILWKQSVPATQQIDELLKEGPPQT